MKINKSLKFIIILLLVVYIASFIVSETGYYEYKMGQRTVLTNKQIKKFEEDVKNNINVDINDYVIDEKADYTNKFTSSVNNTSLTLNKYLKKCVEGVFKILNNVVSD